MFVSRIGFDIAGLNLIPGLLAESGTVGLLAALSSSLVDSSAGEFSGSASAVMNTMGNIGGTFPSATGAGASSGTGCERDVCLIAVFLASSVAPNIAVCK